MTFMILGLDLGEVYIFRCQLGDVSFPGPCSKQI